MLVFVVVRHPEMAIARTYEDAAANVFHEDAPLTPWLGPWLKSSCMAALRDAIEYAVRLGVMRLSPGGSYAFLVASDRP